MTTVRGYTEVDIEETRAQERDTRILDDIHSVMNEDIQRGVKGGCVRRHCPSLERTERRKPKW